MNGCFLRVTAAITSTLHPLLLLHFLPHHHFRLLARLLALFIKYYFNYWQFWLATPNKGKKE